MLDRNDPAHVIARATFGIVQSFDTGASWQWVCEQAVGIIGESDPPMAALADGSLVLLPPIGGAFVSRDRGCSWSAAPPPLQGERTIDLTLDPTNPAHLLVVTSTVGTIDPQGLVSYTNLLVETTDSAQTWLKRGTLPADFSVETIEIAPSDPKRIYVSGTASANSLLGIIERSDDGGTNWVRTSLVLPDGSGSLFVSAVDPKNPDRLWIRVPARGDVLGFFPATLFVSTDKGLNFVKLAATQKGMFGFALSPDGAKLAYGGPSDGLYVGPSDGSGAFVKKANLGIRCLRWSPSGLYACATQPTDPFSVGQSADEGASFQAIYRMADTCPKDCADNTQFATVCREPWANIGPAIGAASEACSAADAGSEAGPSDSGGVAGAGGGTEGGTRPVDAGKPMLGARPSGSAGCACRTAMNRGSSGFAAALGALVLTFARRRRRVRTG